MIAGIFGGSGFVAPCTRVLSNSDLSRRFVHRTSDRSRSEVLCTHGGQPSELVQSPSENDSRAGCLGGLVTNLRFQEEGNRMPRRS
ncbi:hypothetical protein, partial [Klebsiella quasipneumoniae]|uniref:hypothetical protein n=1 Tax=Klebsiella quasipneumoniae TaxID=1463165 RepID=UPI00222F53DF